MFSLIRKYIFLIIRYILPLFVFPKQKIIFISVGPSGCNSYALFKYFKKNESEVAIELYHDEWKRRPLTLFEYFRRIYTLSLAKVLVTTHGPISLPNRVELNTWHGPLFKSVRIMENPSIKTQINSNFRKVDKILSYSQLYLSLLVACTMTNPYRHKITGAPRNDFLFDSNGRSNLEKILGKNLEKKTILMFVPTFRKGYSKIQGSKNFNNLFGFKNFQSESFNSFLKENNLFFVYKLHPNEEKYFNDYKDLIDPKFSYHLNNQVLSDNKFDFYEILNCADILITDYSGIFIDYLLLNRPIIFNPTDLGDYERTRGFLYTPYNQWTPGPKIETQEGLINEVKDILKGEDPFANQRQLSKNIWHQYTDNKSSFRSAQILKELLYKNKKI